MPSKLRIPTVTLPERMQIRKRTTNDSFPIAHPFNNISMFPICWRTEKMNMIGHNHITTNQPLISSSPCTNNGIMNALMCKHITVFVCANS